MSHALYDTVIMSSSSGPGARRHTMAGQQLGRVQMCGSGERCSGVVPKQEAEQLLCDSGQCDNQTKTTRRANEERTVDRYSLGIRPVLRFGFGWWCALRGFVGPQMAIFGNWKREDLRSAFGVLGCLSPCFSHTCSFGPAALFKRSTLLSQVISVDAGWIRIRA